MCLCAGVLIPQNMNGHQRIACGSQLSPSIHHVGRREWTQNSSLAARTLTLWAISPAPCCGMFTSQMAQRFGWHQQKLHYQSSHCLYRTLPRNIRRGLQEGACNWNASWPSARTDYALWIIRRYLLSQWSRHQKCVQGGKKWPHTIMAISYSFQHISLGAAASHRQAKTSTANHHGISSLEIHPLRGFKFYFQIHSDLYSKVGVVSEALATGNN